MEGSLPLHPLQATPLYAACSQGGSLGSNPMGKGGGVSLGSPNGCRHNLLSGSKGGTPRGVEVGSGRATHVARKGIRQGCKERPPGSVEMVEGEWMQVG